MLIPLKQFIGTALVSTIALVPIASVGLVLTSDVAFAKGKKEKKAKNERRVKAPKVNHGSIARQLGRLNAAHSLRNGQGYLHASANSNIGMIATYGSAQYALGDAQSAYDAFVDSFYPTDAYEFVNSQGLDCNNLVDSVGDAECTTIAEYETYISSDAEYLTSLSLLQADIDDAQSDHDLAFSDIGGDELSDPALNYFNMLLSFGDFSLSQPTNAEFSENEPDDVVISDVSLTF